jgi:hypothetical protein
MPVEIRSDYEFFMKAVQLYGGSLNYASEKIKSDKNIVLESIKIIPGLANERSILHASDTYYLKKLGEEKMD